MQQQFLVPQFIDVEDKIIGPITTRQFVIMLVATLFIFITFQFLQFWFFVVVSILLVIIFGILAFLKINGMPFHYFLLNLVQTTRRPNVRIWDKKIKDSELKKLMAASEVKKEVEEEIIAKKVSSTKLSKLSLIVNTGGIYQGED